MKKYLKDYSLNPKAANNGKIKEDIEYIGKYYISGQDRKELGKYKRYCLLLALCGVVMLTGAGLLNTSGSRVFYIAVPYACQFLPAIFGLMGAIRLLRSDDRLEYAAYDKSVKRMYHSTVGVLILNIIVVIGDILFLLSGSGTGEMLSEIVFLTCMLILLLISLLFLKVQKKIVYVEEGTVTP